MAGAKSGEMRLKTIKVSDTIGNLPVVELCAIAPSGKRGRTCLARLDTGADVSCIPAWSVRRVLLPFDRYVRLSLANGLYTVAQSRRADIEILKNGSMFGLFNPQKGVVVVGNTHIGLLGMDILKYLRLEGFESEWTLSFPKGG